MPLAIFSPAAALQNDKYTNNGILIMNPQLNPQAATPDFEGKMAKSELYRAAKMSMKLFQMIQDGQQLEGWVQAKITKSADYLDSVYHYMEYQVKFGGGAAVTSVTDITGDISVEKPEPEEADKEEMEESMNYEQHLQALLEGAVKKAKKDYDKDGKIESEKDEVIGSRRRAAGLDKNVKEGFPTVASAKADAEKKKTTGKFDVKKTSTGTQYTRKSSTFTDGGDDKDTKVAKKKAKVKEASTKFDPLKHVKNPTPGEKKAAKDVKRGSYADRAAMLRSAEKDGRLKEADYSAKKAAAGKDIGKPGKNFAKIEKSAGGGEKGKKIAGAVLAKLRAKG
jgi:hypothetical protein